MSARVLADTDAFESRLGEAALAGAGSFELALARWTYARTGDSEVALAALAVVAAEQSGHGCAWFTPEGGVRGFAGLPVVALERLRAHAWVGDGDIGNNEHGKDNEHAAAATPLVLDAAGRCYSWRSHSAERDIAAAVLARCDVPGAAPAWLVDDIDALFAGQDAHASADQRAAVRAAVGTRLFVLSGGPGTGKTTTVVRWLALLLRRREQLGLPARPVIRLAAPTGKAAQRLADSVRDGAASLATLLAADATWADALADLPQDAATLHRLLGYQPRRGGFRHDALQPLPADVVVVDEASMVDLGLMRALLAALRPDARLLLLGDPDQLASVAAGSVLGDIVAAAESQSSARHPTADTTSSHPGADISPVGRHHRADATPPNRSVSATPPTPNPSTPHQPSLFDTAPATSTNTTTAPLSPLARHAYRLRHVWRAGGPLVAFADALRRGDIDAMRALLHAAGDGDESVSLHPVDTPDALRRRLRAWLESPAQSQLQHQLRTPGTDPLAALDALRRGQVLAALREGPFGVAGINSWIDAWMRQRHGVPPGTDWYAGRCVMVTRNDVALGLSNGDIGIALYDSDGLALWFDGRDEHGERRARRLSTRLLPEHTDAWALTIHKSQGSEYNRVAVVLPPDPDSPILSRELLYTGITRARRQAAIWGSDAALASATARPITRYGGLRERLLAGTRIPR